MQNINFLDKFKDAIADNQILINTAYKAIFIIKERTKKGEYLEGSTGDSNYSTKTMPVPYGLFIKKLGKSLLKKDNQKVIKSKIKGADSYITTAKSDEFSVVRNKNGKPIVLIKGGYKRWRELNKKTTSPVAMHWTARMMRNLGITRTDNLSVETGFPSAEENKKAYYQHIGAGKNKTTRLFMGLSQSEEDKIVEHYRTLIFKKMME